MAAELELLERVAGPVCASSCVLTRGLGALLFGVLAATSHIVSCRGSSSGAGRGNGLSIRRDSWDDALVLLPAVFNVLAAPVACLAPCLASYFITSLSIFFACFAFSSKRLYRALTATGVTGVPLANHDNSAKSFKRGFLDGTSGHCLLTYPVLGRLP